MILEPEGSGHSTTRRCNDREARLDHGLRRSRIPRIGQQQRPARDVERPQERTLVSDHELSRPGGSNAQ